MLGIQAGYAMWIDLMYYLSYVKLYISFIKYLPQVTYDFFKHGQSKHH